MIPNWEARYKWLPRFKCEHCCAAYHSVVSHPNLGPVCPICLRPIPARRSRRAGKGAVKRRRIAIRDCWQCHLCKAPVDPRGKGDLAPSLDHLKPVSLGGSNEDGNLKLAHVGCNRDRGNTLLEVTGA